MQRYGSLYSTREYRKAIATRPRSHLARISRATCTMRCRTTDGCTAIPSPGPRNPPSYWKSVPFAHATALASEARCKELAQQFGLPVRYIGVGEGIDDLRTFNAEEFTKALFQRDADEQ